MSVQTKIRCVVMMGALALFAAVLPGCYSVIEPARGGWADPRPTPVPVQLDGSQNAVVFSTPEVVGWERATGQIDAARPEFGRRDALVSARERAPMRATQAWPVPPRPIERPVRFFRFRQR